MPSARLSSHELAAIKVANAVESLTEQRVHLSRSKSGSIRSRPAMPIFSAKFFRLAVRRNPFWRFFAVSLFRPAKSATNLHGRG
jgi:hypothetical protein